MILKKKKEKVRNIGKKERKKERMNEIRKEGKNEKSKE
jgi:hypothetical protein